MYAGNVGPATTCVRRQFHCTRPPAAGEPALPAGIDSPRLSASNRSIHRKEAPGSIVVDTDARFLYYVLPEEKAIRYGVIVGEDAQAWSGVAKVGRKQEWPSWTPTEGEKRRLGPLPNYVEGGAHNPMGARGIYLYSDDKDTLYRIHGTNQPQWIGHAISSGCIRMTNEDVIDLYSRVKMGTIVVVLGPKQDDSRIAAAAISRAN
jgi:lipoprotein-anchoring transpeptidase ErfK/SrfK